MPRPALLERFAPARIWPVLLLGVPAVAIVLWGVAAVLLLGWTELYADQWRLYPLHLGQPFPLDLLVYDNGHRQVVPAVLRVAEPALGLHGQQLQLLAGVLAALLALGLVARCAWQDPRLGRPARWAAFAMAAFALFWLGNARILLSGYESPSDYLLTALVIAALLQVARPALATRRQLGLAALFGALAAFCYGSGIAGLVAVAWLLVLQRDYRGAGWMALAVAATVALYLLLPAASANRGGLAIRPLENLATAATWLGSMWANLFAAAVNLDRDSNLPAALRPMTRWLADAFAGAADGRWENPRRFAAPTVLALAWLGWASWRLWRLGDQGRTRKLGIGLAWFAFGMAAIVSIGRLEYFREYPDQLFANRYQLWSCLFWLGIVLAALAGAGAGRWSPLRLAAPVLVVAVVVAVGLASRGGYWLWGGLVQQGIRLDAAGIAAGVVEEGRSLGETSFEEVVHFEPVLRTHGISLFAWPETQLQARAVDLAPATGQVSAQVLRATAVGNRLRGGTAVRLAVLAHRHADVEMPARLLVASEGVAVGILVRQPLEPGWHYAGYARASAGEALAIGPLIDDTRMQCWTGCRRVPDP
jgi:hypothetical protein